MTSKREVLRQQRRWAKTAGLAVDSRGYLDRFELNLRAPLSQEATRGFALGRGSELEPQRARPAKMCALHSSAALAVNVFDHWTARDTTPLRRSLGLDAAIVAIAFERRFETGLSGSPPNLDVALELESGAVVGIESKFTEWLTPKRTSRRPFKDKYFEGGAERWAERGLARCQRLAEDMMEGKVAFRHLDAAQLLKHALGLATERPGRCALLYLHLDIACPASVPHRVEIERFAARVDDALGFRGEAYQTLLERLEGDAAVDADYVGYLRRRYCDKRVRP